MTSFLRSNEVKLAVELSKKCGGVEEQLKIVVYFDFYKVFLGKRYIDTSFVVFY